MGLFLITEGEDDMAKKPALTWGDFAEEMAAVLPKYFPLFGINLRDAAVAQLAIDAIVTSIRSTVMLLRLRRLAG